MAKQPDPPPDRPAFLREKTTPNVVNLSGFAYMDPKRAANLEKIAEMLLRGYTQTKIAQTLKMKPYRVNIEVQVLKRLWLEQAVEKTAEWKAQLIQMHMWRIQQASSAWDASRRTKIRRQTSNSNDGKPPLVKESEDPQAGDPRFLDQIGGACQELSKLTGAYAPSEHRILDDGNRDAISRIRKNLSIDQLRAFNSAFKMLEADNLQAKAVDVPSTPVPQEPEPPIDQAIDDDGPGEGQPEPDGPPEPIEPAE